MNYSIDRDGREPAYIQLYRRLAGDIASGGYSYGMKIPSKRVIAAETGVSVITAEHALTLLAEEGYIESRERSGCFVVYRDSDFATTARSRNLSADREQEATEEYGTTARREDSADIRGRRESRRTEFPFSVLARTIRKVLLDRGDRLLVKSPNQGCEELREELCGYLARSRGISVTPSRIVVGSGAEYLYGMIVQLLGTSRGYAVEKPSYRRIADVYRAMGARVDRLPMTDTGITSAALRRTSAQILHVTPFNSFPSGITADISKKREYLRWAEGRNGVLIEDNYDSELTVSRKSEEPLVSMADGVDVIYLNTFSGTIAPSIRIGYMVLPEHLAETFRSKLGFYSCTVPTLEQFVLAELLHSGDFERHINRVRRRKRVEAGTKVQAGKKAQTGTKAQAGKKV